MNPVLFVSLLPERTTSYNISFQVIRKPDFFPSEIQKLVDAINESSDQIEVERAADEYLSYLHNKLDEMLEKALEARAREATNQRKFYVISLGPVILENKDGDPVYLASVIGRGDSKELSPVVFNREYVAEEVTEIPLNPSRHGEAVIRKVGNEIFLNDMPLDEAFDIERAVEYYERSYQRVSTMDNFAPIIDSGFDAASLFIEELLNLFRPFPDILQQRLNQLERKKGDGRIGKYDILGIRKLALSGEFVRFEGIGINHDQSSFVVAKILDGMKLYILGDFPTKNTNHVITHIKDNKELRYQIEEHSRNQFKQQRIDARKFAQLNNHLGIKVLSKFMECNEIEEECAVPFAFVTIHHGENSVRVSTNFDRYELPDSVVAVLENLARGLEVVATGPLGIFGYRVDEISIRFSDGKHTYLLSYEIKEGRGEQFNFRFYYVVRSSEELISIFERRDKSPPAILQGRKLDQIAHEAEGSIQQLSSEEGREIRVEVLSSYLMNQRALVSLSQDLFSDEMSPILLKRMLSELLDEEMILSKSDDAEEQFSYEVERSELDQKVAMNLLSSEQEMKIDEKRHLLMREMNYYNPGLSQFLLDSYHRDEIPLKKEVYRNEAEQIYDYLEQVFNSYRVALIDAGLTAQEWRFMSTELLETTFSEQYSRLKKEVEERLQLIFGDRYSHEYLSKLIQSSAVQRRTYPSFNRMIPLRKKIIWQDYIHLKVISGLLNELGDDPPVVEHLDGLLKKLGAKGRKINIQLPEIKPHGES